MFLISTVLCLATYALTYDNKDASLFEAIKRNCEDEVRQLSTPAAVNTCDDNGRHPLQLAVKKGNYAIVEILLNAGAEVNPPLEGEEKPPLFLACSKKKKNTLAVVELLLNRGADSTVVADGADFFSYCLQRRAWSVAKYLLDRPDVAVDVNRKIGSKEHGIPPLIYCCMIGNYDAVDAILRQPNVDLEFADILERTALFKVVFDGTGELARALIAKGANANHQDVMGQTPLHMASARGNSRMTRVLLENGANPNIRNKRKLTPIVKAFSRSQRDFSHSTMECARILLRHGADLTSNGATKGKRIIDDMIDVISPLEGFKFLVYAPLLIDLLEIEALNTDQLDKFKAFAVSPRARSFENYFRDVRDSARDLGSLLFDIFREPLSENNLDRVIGNVESYLFSDLCAVLVKFYELSNKIRLPRVYEFVVEDNVLAIYYEERERIFARTYFSKIPFDLFRSIWMDVMNPEVAEKCKLRGLTLRVIGIMSGSTGNAFQEKDFELLSKQQLRPFFRDLIREIRPNLTEDLRARVDTDEYDETDDTSHDSARESDDSESYFSETYARNMLM